MNTSLFLFIPRLRRTCMPSNESKVVSGKMGDYSICMCSMNLKSYLKVSVTQHICSCLLNVMNIHHKTIKDSADHHAN